MDTTLIRYSNCFSLKGQPRSVLTEQLAKDGGHRLLSADLLMRRWLEDFAYRVELEAPIFVAIAAASLLIAFATVSVHAAKTARTNPADSLRFE